MRRVLCCGLTTFDVTHVVDRTPRADEKVVARSTTVDVGGPAANAARTVAALGHPVTLVTALGDGPLARVTRDLLAAAGADLVDVADDDADVPVSTVLVTAGTGQRAVASTNARGRRTRRDAHLPADTGCVLVDGHLLDVQVALAQRARSAGVVSLLDGGSYKPGLERLLAAVDVALLSADFTLPGDAPDVHDAVAALGPTAVARSAGPGPVELLEGAARRVLPVPAVDPVVDTLGAGDVLHGAVAAALAGGAGVGEALEAGIAVATESVRHAGALGWARRDDHPGQDG